MKKLTLVFCLIFLQLANSQDRYSSASGSGSHSGLDQSNEWSYTEMDGNATAGMTVHMKAGQISSSLAFNNNGTVSNPIKIIGYLNSPNDIVSTDSPTMSHTSTFSSANMPLLRGSSRASGTAININGDYVHLENIQVDTYRSGIVAQGDNVTLKNVFVGELGDLGPNTPTVISDDLYSGFAITPHGDNFLLENSVMRNAGAELLVTKGGIDGVIKNCYGYGNEAQNPTDYYVNISNGSTGWLVEGTTMHRTASLVHGGHGFMVKSDGQYNTFRDCVAIGTQLEANFGGVTNNTWENITMTGYGTDGGNWHTRIFCTNGASDNTFKNITMTDINIAIVFGDYDDGYTPNPDTDELAGGYDNHFENIVVNNVDQFISGTYAPSVTGSDTHPSSGNSFKNITIDEARIFCTIITDWSDFTFENIGIKELTTNLLFNLGPNGTKTNFTSTDSKYYLRNGSGTDTGWSQTGDPLLASNTPVISDDYILQSGSPWIGSGANGKDVGYQFIVGAPTCSDGIQNGTETGIDCGGSCAPCVDLNSILILKQKARRRANNIITTF